MPTTTTITFLHALGDDEEGCQDEIEVELDYTPGEVYGSDADGNRGVWQSGYFENISDTPLVCEECGRAYSDEERTQLEAEMNAAAEAHSEDAPEPYELDGPDYDRDDY